MAVTLKLSCSKHPRYKGKQEPKAEFCQSCWELYDLVQGGMNWFRMDSHIVAKKP